jgi:hypothetical protein
VDAIFHALLFNLGQNFAGIDREACGQFFFSTPNELPKRILQRRLANFGGQRYVTSHFPAKPSLGEAEVATHNVYRYGERYRRLLRGHANEVPHFDEPRLLRICLFEPVEGVVQRQQGSIGPQSLVCRIQKRYFACGGALLGSFRAGGIHQNLPHQPGSDPIEMRSIFIRRVLAPSKPQEGFMNESRGLERDRIELATQVSFGQLL